MAVVAITEQSPTATLEFSSAATVPRLRDPAWLLDRIEKKIERANQRLEQEGVAERFELEGTAVIVQS